MVMRVQRELNVRIARAVHLGRIVQPPIGRSLGMQLPYLQGVVNRPEIDDEALQWAMDGPAEVLPAAHAVEEWSRVTRNLPGRLRPCINAGCNKFLIDQSRPNMARWCSRADCGNRLKARRHQARLMSGHKA
jgi:predicted RNA-binding Zn ribbon-like protein